MDTSLDYPSGPMEWSGVFKMDVARSEPAMRPVTEEVGVWD